MFNAAQKGSKCSIFQYIMSLLTFRRAVRRSYFRAVARALDALCASKFSFGESPAALPSRPLTKGPTDAGDYDNAAIAAYRR
ncbi:protein of unknown function [Methylocella tundrae]|uniref:Uncharacterized protein n=1 Tax=Methylocella tundrae TaxID=227605 RepID=A0A4U8Z1C1_METTU|nr:protein of unknown function [Methylocella tundrae]